MSDREKLLRARDAVRDLVRAKRVERDARIRSDPDAVEPSVGADVIVAMETSGPSWTPIRLAVLFELEGVGVPELDELCPLSWAALNEALAASVMSETLDFDMLAREALARATDRSVAQ